MVIVCPQSLVVGFLVFSSFPERLVSEDSKQKLKKRFCFGLFGQKFGKYFIQSRLKQTKNTV